MSLNESISQLRDKWNTFSTSPAGKRLIKIARVVFLLAILVYLAFELSAIGWNDIWENLPTQPLYYLLFLLLYFLVPATELLIYRQIWDFSAVRAFPAFIKKRVYNRDVMGYSGEVFFFTWARKHFGKQDLHLIETIRDNNIISSAASTLVAVIFLGIFLAIGRVSIQDLLGENLVYYVLGGLVLLGILTPIAIRFRRYIFSMPFRLAVFIFGIQVLRLSVGQTLQISQWVVVIPDVPLSIWFTYAAVSIILTRIPFIPNHSLIFLGVGVGLSDYMDVPKAAIAGMLLVSSVLDKILNVGLFGLITVYDSRSTPESPAEHSTDPGFDSVSKKLPEPEIQ